ncbi:MAG: hypothetical protein KDD51_17185 [Bdellovibrionales bacterium]|nr:hypothetical protein [Bdellovibrionales bacterium]
MGILSFFAVVERFHLDPEYFPEITKDLFSIEEILKHGVLPLGFKQQNTLVGKKQYLNVGFLSPRDTKQIAAVEALLKAKHQAIAGFLRYQVELIEYLQVLERVYDTGRDSVSKRASNLLHPLLQSHFQPH